VVVQRTRTAFDGYLEMPAVNPNSVGKRHTYCYGYHSIFEDPQIGIAKVNVEGGLVEIWKPGPFRFALEPRFIPRRAEDESALGGKQEKEQDDDGWLIAQLFDSKEMSSEVVILDARNLAAGPVAVMALREPLPSALHSCWSDVYYGPDGSPPKDRAVELLAQQEVQPNVVPFTGVDKSRMRGSGEVRKSVRLGRDLN